MPDVHCHHDYPRSEAERANPPEFGELFWRMGDMETTVSNLVKLLGRIEELEREVAILKIYAEGYRDHA